MVRGGSLMEKGEEFVKREIPLKYADVRRMVAD